MANEYRDALQAAQRRIDSLERELEIARFGVARPPPSVAWIWLALPVVFVLGLFGLAFLTMRGRVTEPVSVPAPFVEPLPTVTAPVSYGVTFYNGNNSRLQLVDVDGDGKKELVSLFWGKAVDLPLHVGVLDRETLAVKWMSGPFPSQWSGRHTHMAIVGAHVVVTDSRETVHVLELGSGKVVHTLPLAGGAVRACAISASSVDVGLEVEWNKWSVLDVEKGTLREAKKGEIRGCIGQYVTCSAKSDASRLCTEHDPSAQARSLRTGFTTDGTTEVLGDTRLVSGAVQRPNGKDEAALLVLDRKTKAYRWEAPTILDGDSLHLGGHTKVWLTPNSVVTFYQTSGGDFRLATRDVATGKEVWSTKLVDAKEGSYTGEFFVEDGEIFFFIDHRLHIVDLAMGRERKVVTWL
jgi:hypothetical protein